MSDFLLQKRQDRGVLYHTPPGIWYSSEIKRWMITSPALIREVMHEPAFSVPNYDISPILDRLKIELSGLREITKWFPLATEGERHRFLREKFARQIAKNTKASLEKYSRSLASAIQTLERESDKKPFCLLQQFLKPLLRNAVANLAEVNLPEGTDAELIPQLFDDTISMSRRRRINDIVLMIVQSCPADIDDNEKYFRAALVALSANTLLGSLVLTTSERIQSSPDRAMSEIDWGEDMLRTSLALIEKRALKDTSVGGVPIKRGERLRLFLEAAGVGIDGAYSYSDLFFAVGAHKCVGMNFSRLIWEATSSGFASIGRKMRVIDIKHRDGDHVFNMPEKLLVEFYE